VDIESMATVFKNRALNLLLLAAVALFVCACRNGGTPWETKDISGLMPDLVFRLTEANRDRGVTAEDYRGDILLMYFGYTQCPDVCSTTMLKLYNAVSTLDSDARRVKILFVSVDPNRDTLSVLRSYTHAFGDDVVALRGDQDELRRLTKRYRVTYGYDKPDKDGNYKVSHSSAVYVFDRHGEARLLIRGSDKASAIHHDLARLIRESSTG
jgi:protein SCO1/2